MYADSNGVAKVDSLVVADAFNKDHRNVIRDIRNLDCSEEFRQLNFEQSSYINAQGRSETFYNVIPSYGLLHVIYRFNKKPKK